MVQKHGNVRFKGCDRGVVGVKVAFGQVQPVREVMLPAVIVVVLCNEIQGDTSSHMNEVLGGNARAASVDCRRGWRGSAEQR